MRLMTLSASVTGWEDQQIESFRNGQHGMSLRLSCHDVTLRSGFAQTRLSVRSTWIPHRDEVTPSECLPVPSHPCLHDPFAQSEYTGVT
jgi:hypothetical protein